MLAVEKFEIDENEAAVWVCALHCGLVAVLPCQLRYHTP